MPSEVATALAAIYLVICLLSVLLGRRQRLAAAKCYREARDFYTEAGAIYARTQKVRDETAKLIADAEAKVQQQLQQLDAAQAAAIARRN